ncbi:class I SAM-dependent methyltransferase [Microlunatus sp. Y2014]|uniref:class I SAM-dependent methyltransferase n=1 Tax=Microlunatus sp. Y2014 TaxID=3418488 RepID=UPI003DA76A89
MSNAEAIARWSAMPASAMDAYDDQGDFPKRHLLNDHLLRLLGPVRGHRVLDAGSGQGYFSRILARHGADVTGVEPADALIERSRQLEQDSPLGIAYHQEDLAQLPAFDQPFDAVVCSMVLLAIPDWRPAMASCVSALRPGGRFVFSVVHPAFENLWRTWQRHGHYQLDRYLDEYEIPSAQGMSDFHRPLSAYVNEVISLGCRITELCEPGLDPAVAQRSGIDGIESYVQLPNFAIIGAERC